MDHFQGATPTHDGNISYQETETTSGNGLETATYVDVDGDGDIDFTVSDTRTFEADGRITDLWQSFHANGELRSRSETETSADGRTTTVNTDFDGDGFTDKRVVTIENDDGSVETISTTFEEIGGALAQIGQSTERTSFDGLTTTIEYDDHTETIERSPIDGKSYSFDNGLTATDNDIAEEYVTHVFDASGLETWTLERTDGQGSKTFGGTIDAASKARMFDEANEIYDTVLDRSMTRAEKEGLVRFLDGKELDRAQLAVVLLTSDEYNARYYRDNSAEGIEEGGPERFGLRNSEFVIQTYLNALGRAPSLEELNEHVRALDSQEESRVSFILEIAQSIEHQVVGNGHMATNNFDILLNPVEYERNIDEAHVSSVAAHIIATLYGREAAEYEIEFLVDALTSGTAMFRDAIKDLTALNAHGTAGDQSVLALDGLAFIEEIFERAFGRGPTVEEAQIWLDNLENGLLSKREIVAAFAQSLDRDAINDGREWSKDGGGAGHAIDFAYAGDDLVADLSVLGVTTIDLADDNLDGAVGDDGAETFDALDSTKDVRISGGLGDDTIDGGDGDDLLSGDQGADAIHGQAGDDILFFDADDVDVDGGSGVDTGIVTEWNKYDLGGNTIETAGGVSVDVDAQGFERLIGGDGDDSFVANASHDISLNLQGGGGDDTLTSGAADDVLSGDSGDDEITGNDGDDIIIGGDGEDAVVAGNGNDFILSGEGDDDIEAGGGDDFVLTGDGFDTILGEGGDDYIDSGAGSDTVDAGNGDDVVVTGDGNDQVTAGEGDDYVDTGDGNDLVIDGKGDDIYYTGDGDDIIRALSTTSATTGKDVFLGGKGYDVLRLNGEEADYVIQEISDNRWVVKWNHNLDYGNIKYFLLSDVEAIEFTEPTSGSFILELDGVNEDDDHIGTFEINGARNDAVDASGEAVTANYGIGSDYFDGTEDSGYGDDIDGGSGLDILNGEKGADELNGGTGGDHLYGGNGADSLTGGWGSDVLVGGKGSDELNGNGGADVLVGDGGANFETGQDAGNTSVESGGNSDQIWGGGGEDVIFGQQGDDTLYGEDGSDIIFGGIGDDSIDGGEGADRIEGGDGSDEIVGGVGNDFIEGDGDYSLNVTIHFMRYAVLEQDDPNMKSWTENRVAEIEDGAYDLTDLANKFLGSAYGFTDNGKVFEGTTFPIVAQDDLDITKQEFLTDLLPRLLGVGSVPNDVENAFGARIDNGEDYADLVLEIIANGLADRDLIENAYVEFGEYTAAEAAAVDFDDTIEGGDGNDNIDGGWGDDTIRGDDGNDIIFAGAGDDTAYGHDGDDRIWGGEGEDLIKGGTGADVIEGGLGADTLYGGWTSSDSNGRDILSYAGSYAGVTVNLAIGTASGGDATGDVFQGFEGVAGSKYDDTITGDLWVNILNGNEGFDQISGGDGNDLLSGGRGGDILFGDADQDELDGGAGDDKIDGGADADVLRGGLGRDILDGGADDDLLTGGADGDVFLMSDGNDQVLDFVIGEDRIGVSGVITAGQITFSQVGDDTLVAWNGRSLTLVGIDSAALSLADVAFVMDPSAGTTQDYSTHTGSVVVEANGLDVTITGTDQDDILEGGTGSDTLAGGIGDDTYVLRLRDPSGSGFTADHDTIDDTAGINRVRVDGSIYEDQIIATSNGDDLTLEFGAGGDTITIVDQWVDIEDLAVEFLDLSNGETVDMRRFHPLGGDDELDGTSNADVLFGYVGDDTLSGLDGADVLDGHEGDDYLDGGGWSDTLTGGLGDDTLDGGSGDDSLDGGEGDDVFYESAGHDSYVGGSGYDEINLLNMIGGVTVDLGVGYLQWDGESTQESLVGFERVVGNADDNTLKGNDENNSLKGREGDDDLRGRGGDDYLNGGSGDDVYWYALGDGNDLIHDFSTSTGDVLRFTEGIDYADLWIESNGVNLLIGLHDGSQITIKDFIDNPIETLMFSDGSTVDTDRFHDDDWEGGSGNNIRSGKWGDDTLKGLAGDDTLNGNEGDDRLIGGSGDDILNGGQGDDYISGSTGRDTISGGSGDDMIVDTNNIGDIDGGDGVDTVDASGMSGAIDFDLAGETSTLSDGTQYEFIGVENIIATTGDNTILGDLHDNYIHGQGGDDRIRGKNGNDTLTGGAGDDTFVFGATDGINTITDFQVDQDTIEFANLTLSFGDLEFANHDTGVLVAYEFDEDGEVIGAVNLIGLRANDIAAAQFDFG